MNPSGTTYRIQIQLSDVDRGKYDSLDLRVAQHPSETARYMLTRVIAFALSYEEGIAFSKGGLSSADEAAISIRDATGLLLACIEIGAPSAERLHKAAKSADRVEVYTTSELVALTRELEGKKVHRASEIIVWTIEPKLIAALESLLKKNFAFELTRSDGQLYVTVGTASFSGPIERRPLVTEA